MKINGKVIIEKFNTVTEETTSITEYNDICYTNTQLFVTGRNTARVSIAGVTPVSGQDASKLWQIRTSQYNQKQSKLNHTIAAYSSATADVGYPIWEDGNGTTTKDTFTVVATLYAPPINTTRIINCVALDYNYTNMNDYSFTSGTSASTGTLTNLTLSTPCIQSDTEILSITYKLYFDNYQVEPLSEMSQSTYEYIRYIFKTATLYNQSSVPSYKLNDGWISAATYNPINCDSYSHHGIANSEANRYFNTSVFAHDNDNRATYIGAVYNTYTVGSTDNYKTGTFIDNLHIHSKADNIWETTSLCYKDILRAEQSPVQNIFKHKATCNVPFQSLLPSELSTMTGSISINHTGWVDELLPNNYRIKIVDSGNVGVATYKLEKLKLTAGFLGNTFCPRTAILPQDPANDHLVRYHVKSPRERTLSNQYAMYGGVIYRKLDETSKLFACPSDRLQNYFAVYDVITGNKIVYDSTNITGFGLTNISDADIVSNNIFISCANTGLWKVDLNLATATHIVALGVDDTKCYAIATHSDGSIWALFEGGLGKSTDLGNTWTIYNPSSIPILSKSGLTDNWSNCVQMVLDPTHVDYRFLFNLKTGTTTNRWIWWSTTFTATSPTTAPSIGTVDNYEITDSFKCHNNMFFINDNAADTVGSLYVLAFGASNMSTNTITATFGNGSYGNYGTNILPITVSGISGVLIQTRATYIDSPKSAFFVKDVNLPVTGISYSLTSPTIEFFIRYGASPFASDLRNEAYGLGSSSQFAAYFEDSNFLVSIEPTYSYSSSHYVTCLGCKPIVLEPSHPNYNTYKSGIWREYGWDGSNWVEGEVGAKTTHGTLEEILDGLQVSFADGATSPNFISTDFFNFIVGKGIMKDNATTVTYGIPYYPRRTEKISTFSSFIVPPVSPVSLLDEPVGFSTTLPNETGEVHRYIQNKGMINYITNSQYIVYSDQLIPSNSAFTFRCKFTSLYASTYYGKEIGMAVFSSGTTYNKSLYLRVESNGNVTVRNSANTVVATILAANITIDTEFKFERDGANLISVSYDNNVIYTTTINSQYVVFAQSDSSSSATGFYDCYLSYTENRPFVRIGDSVYSTGSYNPLFAGVTVPSVVPDGYIELDNIPQVRVHKTAGEVQNMGEVKVATGSGWLIFNEADEGKSIEGSFTAHYLY